MKILFPIAFPAGRYSSISVSLPGVKVEPFEPEIVSYREYRERSMLMNDSFPPEVQDSILVALCYIDHTLLSFQEKEVKCYSNTHVSMPTHSYLTLDSERRLTKLPKMFIHSHNIHVSGLSKDIGSEASFKEFYSLYEEEVKHLFIGGVPKSFELKLEEWCDLNRIETLAIDSSITPEDLKRLFEKTSESLGRDCFKSLRKLKGNIQSIDLFFQYFDVYFLEVLKSTQDVHYVQPLELRHLEVDLLDVRSPAKYNLGRVGKVKPLTRGIGGCTVNERMGIAEHDPYDLTYFTMSKGTIVEEPSLFQYRVVDGHRVFQPLFLVLNVEMTPSSGQKSATKVVR